MTDTHPHRGSILITGCSSGIGLITATGLRARGYRVIASARQAKDVKALESQGFEAVQLDLARSESITSAVKQVLEKTGGYLDALFNNAAFGQPGAVEDLSRDVLREQFETNLFGTHELTRQIIPVMRKQGHGRIIFNSSVLGLVAMPYRGAYNASKFALEGLADTLRLELKGSHIHVVLVEPGPILSRFRPNALALYKKNLDPQNSPHHAVYEKLAQKLETEGAAVPFTQGPEAVLKKVVAALESPKPKPRYFVTFPTYLFAFLRRVLPTTLLDQLAKRV